MVDFGDRHDEIQLAAIVVNGLKRFNEGESRNNVLLDKAFIKALLIGLVGIKRLKSAEPIQKGVLNFIKGKKI